jgi:CheY-like chemotaxis protein
LSERTVLIVDDELYLRRAMQRVLTGVGYQAILAENGEEAVDIASSTPLAAMLLDLGLPDKSGANVLEQLRRAGATFPIFIVSADVDPTSEAALLAKGATACFTKPLDRAALLQALADALGPVDP